MTGPGKKIHGESGDRTLLSRRTSLPLGQRSGPESERLGIVTRLSQSSHASVLNIGFLVAASGAWCCGVSTRTGLPDVSTPWQSEVVALTIHLWQHVHLFKLMRPWGTYFMVLMPGNRETNSCAQLCLFSSYLCFIGHVYHLWIKHVLLCSVVVEVYVFRYRCC